MPIFRVTLTHTIEVTIEAQDVTEAEWAAIHRFRDDMHDDDVKQVTAIGKLSSQTWEEENQK